MSENRLCRSVSFAKRQFNFRDPIRPFISSPFQDFQEERDRLVKFVFPRLDSLCRQRGTYCSPVDLRWGISEPAVRQGRIVRLCLDSVYSSAPFFIGLLGQRYGSHRPPGTPFPDFASDCPASSSDDDDMHWMDRNLREATYDQRYMWLLDERYRGCSVTEMEIAAAAFISDTPYQPQTERQNNAGLTVDHNQDTGFDFCRFYFRDPAAHRARLLTSVSKEEYARVYQSETEWERRRMRLLKQRIRASRHSVRMFRDTDDLIEIVLDDWREIIDYLYPPLEQIITDNNKEQFTEWIAHETLAKSRRTAFIETEDTRLIYDYLDEFACECLNTSSASSNKFTAAKLPKPYQFQGRNNSLNSKGSSNKSILLLVGARGCGKTSLLANWVSRFENMANLSEMVLFTHYVGSSVFSADPLAMMRRFIIEMQDCFATDSVTANDSDYIVWRDNVSDYHEMVERFNAALSYGPCVLVLDGLEELATIFPPIQKLVDEMKWLPNVLPDQCRILITCSSFDKTYTRLKKRQDVEVIRVDPPLDESSKRRIIEKHLEVHKKFLSDEQLRRIVNSRLSQTPLFLSMLANELRVFGFHLRLDQHLNSYLHSNNMLELWLSIIKRWIQDYGNVCPNVTNYNGGGSWVFDTLCLIVSSRNGLLPEEILGTLNIIGYRDSCEVTPIDFATFRSAATDALFEKGDGSVYVFHTQFKEAIEYSLLGETSQYSKKQHGGIHHSKQQKTMSRSFYNQQIVSFYMDQPHSKRRTNELLWQLKTLNHFNQLKNILTDPKIFSDICSDFSINNAHSKLELHYYWGLLEKQEICPGKSYIKMFNEINYEDEFETARLGNTIGQFLADLGKFKEAEEILILAHKKLEEGINKFPYRLQESNLRILCTIQESLGNLYRYQLNIQFSEKWFHRSLTSINNLLCNVPDSAEDYRSLVETKGRILDFLGYSKAHNAAREYKQAHILLSEAKECMNEANSKVGEMTVIYHLGVLYLKKERYAEAEINLLQSLSFCEQWFGKTHPFTAEVLNDLAGLYWQRKDNKKQVEVAEELYQKALNIRLKCFSEKHLFTATTCFHLGKLLASKNKNDEAEKYFKRALDTRTKNLGADHVLTKAIEKHLNHLNSIQKCKNKQPSIRNTNSYQLRSKNTSNQRFSSHNGDSNCYNSKKSSFSPHKSDGILPTSGVIKHLSNQTRNGCNYNKNTEIRATNCLDPPLNREIDSLSAPLPQRPTRNNQRRYKTSQRFYKNGTDMPKSTDSPENQRMMQTCAQSLQNSVDTSQTTSA